MLGDLCARERNVGAPGVERCKRRQHQLHGRQRAGNQGRRERNGECRSRTCRIVLVGRRAAAVRVRLRDDAFGPGAAISGLVHRARATGRAAGHPCLWRDLPAGALGPSNVADGEDEDQRRRVSIPRFHLSRMPDPRQSCQRGADTQLSVLSSRAGSCGRGGPSAPSAPCSSSRRGGPASASARRRHWCCDRGGAPGSGSAIR